MEPAANPMEPRSDNELNGSGIRLHGCGKTSRVDRWHAAIPNATDCVPETVPP